MRIADIQTAVIAELAEILAVVMVPHSISSPIGTMASAHL